MLKALAFIAFLGMSKVATFIFCLLVVIVLVFKATDSGRR